MRAATNIKDLARQMHPSLEGFEWLCAQIRHGLGIDHLEISSLFIRLVETLGNNFGGVLNSSQLCTKQMLFATRERRARVDFGREVTSQLLLDKLGSDNVLRLGVRKLNPIAGNVVGNPEHGGVDALAALLLLLVCRLLFLTGENSLHNPIIGLAAEDFAEKFELRRARDNGKALQRLLNEEVSIVTEANSGPLQHLRLVKIIRNDTRLLLGKEMFVFRLDEVGLFSHQAADFVEDLVHLDDLGRGLGCVSIHIEVRLGVPNLEVCLLDEGRDLFKLVVAVLRMVQHDSIKDLNEMRVQVLLDGLAKLLGLTQLRLESVKGFCANAHI